MPRTLSSGPPRSKAGRRLAGPLRTWPAEPQWLERALAARMRRQQILDRTDGTAPRLIAVLTEASLLYRRGSQADRRAQIAHLAAVSRRPNVELRLLRLA